MAEAITKATFPYPYNDTRERLICEHMWQGWYTIGECRQLPPIGGPPTSSTATTLPTEQDKPPPYILHRWIKERLKHHHVILRPIPNTYVPALPKEHPSLYYELNPAAQPFTQLELKEKASWYASTLNINSKLHMPSQPMRSDFYIPSAVIPNVLEEMARQEIPPFDFDNFSFNTNPRDPNSLLYVPPAYHNPWRSFDDLITQRFYDKYPCYDDLLSAGFQMNNTVVKASTPNDAIHTELLLFDDDVDYYYSSIAPTLKRARELAPCRDNKTKRIRYNSNDGNTYTTENLNNHIQDFLQDHSTAPSVTENEIAQFESDIDANYAQFESDIDAYYADMRTN
jgi:hypothetical protein